MIVKISVIIGEFLRFLTESSQWAFQNFLKVQNALSEVQGSFRPAHRCEDHLFTLKGICACRLAEGKKTVMAFLDQVGNGTH